MDGKGLSLDIPRWRLFKRILWIAGGVIWIVAGVILTSILRDHEVWRSSWWKVILACLPEVVLPILTYVSLIQSNESDALRAKLELERNQHLEQIAKNTQRPITQAERNAALLRKHIGTKVAVSEGDANWSAAPEIVEVGDGNIVTLFTPRGFTTSTAWCVKVQCGDLEITDIPQGACPLRLKVNRRYGPDVNLGEITKWEDRLQMTGNSPAVDGPVAYHASFSKQGTPGRREVRIFASVDGANLFKLESSTGNPRVGDNEEISKQFALLLIEYEAAGFNRVGFGTGTTTHRLFIH